VADRDLVVAADDHFTDDEPAGFLAGVSVVLRGRIRGSDEEVSVPETHVLKILDGMAVEGREYRTLDEALEAVDLAG